jgi:murein DD-endopeptidase MepM/ murein hydrolase activator NlpD
VNPFQIIELVRAGLSYRKEFYTISLIFLGILLIPLLSMIILTNVGINAVSKQLITVNSQTQQVEVKDPTGKITTEINGPFTWPVRGVVTLEFGESDLPYQAFHSGIDIANPNGKTGDPITAFMPGIVTYAGEINWGFGKHVIVDNGNNITSIYAHLDTINVQIGQKVQSGNVIGTEGQTGWATGPHLHFQINVFGIPVNPRVFLGT